MSVSDRLRLRRPLGQIRRVGHKGAAALAPENTLEAIEVALSHGVDMVEFDVVASPQGDLVLAHDTHDIHDRSPTLDAALELLVDRAPDHVGIDLDLKWPGYEDRALQAVRSHDLLDRTLVCSLFPESLRAVRSAEPAATIGFSYPYDRRGIGEHVWGMPAVIAAALTLRAVLPARILRMLRAAHADVAVLHYSVVSAATVARCHRHGVPVLAWTIDDRDVLRSVVAAGVDGVITNNPVVFDTI